MNKLISIILIAFVLPSFAAPDGKPLKVTSYDYHDFLNESIQSKTFNLVEVDGSENLLIHTFIRPVPGEIHRTDIYTDEFGIPVRQTEVHFQATEASLNLLRVINAGADGTVYSTINYDTPVEILTGTMSVGFPWISTGFYTRTDQIGETTSYITFDKSQLIEIEDVTVPAGAYTDCLKVHRYRNTGMSSYADRVRWYCPDVGLVKEIRAGMWMYRLSDVTY